jgi:hypothetical protein
VVCGYCNGATKDFKKSTSALLGGADVLGGGVNKSNQSKQ